MSRGFDLAEALRRLAPRLERMFRRHGVTPSEAAGVLDDAVLEVQLRASRTHDCEARLLRAVERGCKERLEARRRQAMKVLEQAGADGERGRAEKGPGEDPAEGSGDETGEP